jgi:hypothetical protein
MSAAESGKAKGRLAREDLSDDRVDLVQFVLEQVLTQRAMG